MLFPNGCDIIFQQLRTVPDVWSVPFQNGWPGRGGDWRVTTKFFGGICNYGKRCIYEAAAGSRRPLRTSDPPLEPQDGSLHLHGAQRHLYHRPAEDRQEAGGGLRLRPPAQRERPVPAVCGHQEAGPGRYQDRGAALRHVLCQRTLAGRHDDQLQDHAHPCGPPHPAQATCCPRRKSSSIWARSPSWRSIWAA